MKNALNKVSKAIKRVFFRFKSPLPLGLAEFHAWADSIVDVYSLPDNDSTRWTLATMILHCTDNVAALPKRYFAMRVLKAMSAQVADYVMRDLKDKQKAQIEALQKAAMEEAQKNKSAEVTATSPAETNESKQS